MFVRLRQASWVMVMLLLLGALVSSLVKAQEEDEVGIEVQFNGHSFELPRSIADGFTAFVIDQPTEALDGSDAPQPPRTEFRLLTYTDSVEIPPATGWVSVYTVEDLEGSAAYEQLRDLLDERPDLIGEATLPTLYPYQRSALSPENYTEFFTNAAYLEAEGYQGITYVYGRAIHVGDNEPILFYRVYFEGISSDGQRYLSAQVEGPAALIEPLEGVTAIDEYITQAKALFNESTDEDVIAWLSQAELMFSSFDTTG